MEHFSFNSNFVHNHNGSHCQSHGFASASPHTGHTHDRVHFKSLKRTPSDSSFNSMISPNKYAKLTSGLFDHCMIHNIDSFSRSRQLKYEEKSCLPYDEKHLHVTVPSSTLSSLCHNELLTTERESSNGQLPMMCSPQLQKVNNTESEMVDVESASRLSQSSSKGCPECAAGKSGHIRHIGRWRLMDTS